MKLYFETIKFFLVTIIIFSGHTFLNAQNFLSFSKSELDNSLQYYVVNSPNGIEGSPFYTEDWQEIKLVARNNSKYVLPNAKYDLKQEDIVFFTGG